MRRASAALILAVATTVPALPQIPLNGPEFQVNTSEHLYSSDAAVASDPAGDFVVTWQELAPNFDSRIRARRFDLYGVGLGGDILVSSLLAPTQFEPDVAVEPGGRFLVVFSSWDSTGTDDSFSSIQARLFDPSGAPLGPEFQVNQMTENRQYEPSVAADGSGRFVVAWTSEPAPTLSHWRVRGRRFDRDGAPLGDEFPVNGMTSESAWQPDVAAASDGRFVVAWNYTPYWTWARRFDADGLPLGPDLSVNDLGIDGRYPAVAIDPSGGFLVVWSGGFGRAFDADGQPLDQQFQVGRSGYDNYFLDVASDSGGNLLVPWLEVVPAGGGARVVAKSLRLDEPGTPGEDLVEISKPASSNAGKPRVATNGVQGFVVVWSNPPETAFGDRNIHARRLGDLFSDGFESGSTGRWSGAVP